MFYHLYLNISFFKLPTTLIFDPHIKYNGCKRCTILHWLEVRGAKFIETWVKILFSQYYLDRIFFNFINQHISNPTVNVMCNPNILLNVGRILEAMRSIERSNLWGLVFSTKDNGQFNIVLSWCTLIPCWRVRGRLSVTFVLWQVYNMAVFNWNWYRLYWEEDHTRLGECLEKEPWHKILVAMEF